RQAVLAQSAGLRACAEAAAQADVLLSLAKVAADAGWVRPIVDDGDAIEIAGGRHPVVERALAQSGDGPFVPNDVELDAQRRLIVLTGPNMAGKSTAMRQVALIAVLAQAGSFVPAARARVGIVDRLFTRVGAADDLARGQSTFMVEMAECARILPQATPRSLLILDEVGRGNVGAEELDEAGRPALAAGRGTRRAQLGLCEGPRQEHPPTTAAPIEEALRGLDLSRTTPMDALLWLHEQQKKLR